MRETERARGAMRRFEGSVEPGPFFDCGRETMMGDRQGGDGEERVRGRGPRRGRKKNRSGRRN